MATKQERALALRTDWETNPRWKGIVRPYSAEEVVNISGSVQIEYTLAKNGAEKAAYRCLGFGSWRFNRQPGYTGSIGRYEGHLPFGLAGCG